MRPARQARDRDPGPAGPLVTGRQPAGRRRLAPRNWRVRWRLAAVIAVPAAVAAAFGGVSIAGDVAAASLAGRVQHLTQLTATVVRLTQAVEDERDLSAGYAADRLAAGPLAARLTAAQHATSAAARTVGTDAAGVTTAAGYQPATVADLSTLTASLKDLPYIRLAVTSSQYPPGQIIQVYTNGVIAAASTFTASAGNGASDPDLQGDVTTLSALLGTENQMSVQRAILFAALSSAPPVLTTQNLASLQQAQQQQAAGQASFAAAAGQAGQQNFSNTVSGPAVDRASAQETLAGSMAGGQPLTAHGSGLTAASWYASQTATITRTRQVTGQLTAAITARAAALASRAARSLTATSLLTLLLLLLAALVSATVARSLTRPLRKLRTEALDVAGRRLPDLVRQLSQAQDTDVAGGPDPIGVTSADEIGEVARAFDQVHREAARLAGNEAMLRATLNAMFINLSRSSQSLIERQLSLIDSLEQTEQDPGRLSSLFRLDHLATRMRRNCENLLILAGYETARLGTRPVPLVDVLRAAISEIEQYNRITLNVQPGTVIAGRAISDIVHLVAEIAENATAFSPHDTPVHVSGQPLSTGGVLLDITDNGTGMTGQEIADANSQLGNPPVTDVTVSRRMGLFVVGRRAARPGVRVRLQPARPSGLTALIWLPDTIAAPEITPPPARLRHREPGDYGLAPALSAPPQLHAASTHGTMPAQIPNLAPAAAPAPQPSAQPPQEPAPAPDPRNNPDAPAAPATAQDNRLPIFDTLESEWFRRTGTPLSTSGAQVPAQSPWTSPADDWGAPPRRPRHQQRARPRKPACPDGSPKPTSCPAQLAAPTRKPARPPGPPTRPAPAWPASSAPPATAAQPHPRTAARNTDGFSRSARTRTRTKRPQRTGNQRSARDAARLLPFDRVHLYRPSSAFSSDHGTVGTSSPAISLAMAAREAGGHRRRRRRSACGHRRSRRGRASGWGGTTGPLCGSAARS
jgi:signal transduction histidine kinase